jgi:hypothetical protein
MSTWEPYLRATLPRPTDADRARLESLAGALLPDQYWQVVCEHQGEVLEGEELELPGEGGINFGVLLLASSPQAVGKESSSYCVEDCFESMQDRYPAGMLPFADDTGGNFWAFDFRRRTANPAIVFVDHEKLDEEGVTHAADSFEAFMKLAGAE